MDCRICDAASRGVGHVNTIGRRGMAPLVKEVGLRLQPARFHHGQVFHIPVARALGIDDGHCFNTR
jgi:hypothetical protein